MNALARVSPEDRAKILILEAMQSLPQFKHFTEDDVNRFVQSKANDSRALWHVSRLTGIGGSEIGVAVAEYRGLQDAFGNTVADLVREKLLVVPPKKITMAMRKGLVSEDAIRQIFLEDYKASQDEQTLSRMNLGELKGSRTWMRYSPDDIVMIGGKRYLTDYKRPAEASLHDDIRFRYICQLHLGRQILEHNGIQVDGMLLAQFPEAGQGDDLIVSEILYDESIDADIVTAGDAAWNRVLAGQIPAARKRDGEKALPEKVVAELNEMSLEFARYKAMTDTLIDAQKEIQERMATLMASNGLKSNAIFAGVKVSASFKFSAETAVQALGDDACATMDKPLSAEMMSGWITKHHPEVNVSQFETGEAVINEGKLLELLNERQMSVDQFMVSTFRMIVTSTNAYKEEIGSLAMVTNKLAPLLKMKEVKEVAATAVVANEVASKAPTPKA